METKPSRDRPEDERRADEKNGVKERRRYGSLNAYVFITYLVNTRRILLKLNSAPPISIHHYMPLCSVSHVLLFLIESILLLYMN